MAICSKFLLDCHLFFFLMIYLKKETRVFTLVTAGFPFIIIHYFKRLQTCILKTILQYLKQLLFRTNLFLFIYFYLLKFFKYL